MNNEFSKGQALKSSKQTSHLSICHKVEQLLFDISVNEIFLELLQFSKFLQEPTTDKLQ